MAAKICTLILLTVLLAACQTKPKHCDPLPSMPDDWCAESIDYRPFPLLLTLLGIPSAGGGGGSSSYRGSDDGPVRGSDIYFKREISSIKPDGKGGYRADYSTTAYPKNIR